MALRAEGSALDANSTVFCLFLHALRADSLGIEVLTRRCSSAGIGAGRVIDAAAFGDDCLNEQFVPSLIKQLTTGLATAADALPTRIKALSRNKAPGRWIFRANGRLSGAGITLDQAFPAKLGAARIGEATRRSRLRALGFGAFTVVAGADEFPTGPVPVHAAWTIVKATRRRSLAINGRRLAAITTQLARPAVTKALRVNRASWRRSSTVWLLTLTGATAHFSAADSLVVAATGVAAIGSREGLTQIVALPIVLAGAAGDLGAASSQ